MRFDGLSFKGEGEPEQGAGVLSYSYQLYRKGQYQPLLPGILRLQQQNRPQEEGLHGRKGLHQPPRG